MKKIVLTLLFITTIFAQDVVSIVTSGDGPTKDQATTAALRNAIEQAYGAFISSNTKFLNDELIQDEIVSLSQGTITEYSIISSIETKNGYNVTTKSTVSLGKLTSFVQSKGGSITINGSSFYRNLLIEEFYDTNEHKAIEDFIDSRLKSGVHGGFIPPRRPVWITTLLLSFGVFGTRFCLLLSFWVFGILSLISIIPFLLLQK